MPNNILQLKGEFKQMAGSGRPQGPTMGKKQTVTSEHLRTLARQLMYISDFWEKERSPFHPLVSAHYDRVIPKSRRIVRLLADDCRSSDKTMVGARFDDSAHHCHIMTHCVKPETLERSRAELEECAKIVDKRFDGEVDSEQLKSLAHGEIEIEGFAINCKTVAQLIADCASLERLGIPDSPDIPDDTSLVTLYKTDVLPKEALEILGIETIGLYGTDEATFLLTPDQIALLREKAPWLVAMAVEDLNEYELDDDEEEEEILREPFSIESPSNQPIIGVIDTLFDESVYFSEWVESVDCLSPDIERSPDDTEHGTEVCSIIVDGPSLNPMLDDGCGRFRVKHYGVAGKRGFGSYSVIRAIREAVRSNPGIKVWNLSLGSTRESPRDFVSSEAAELDRIQAENDVVFVIAGTNGEEPGQRVGAPADSINGIVVNSCRSDGSPASYSRRGPVLSFFNKPDLCAFGGDAEVGERIQVSVSRGRTSRTQGTSFAAPWVARKLAYLIHIAGLSRECAKALLIDSAIKWGNDLDPCVQGFGVVPKRIEDILRSPDNEIRFLVQGVSEKHVTYTYNLPVPIVKDKHPFYAKAVMCYFPQCSRLQGVDYTDTELDLKIGRINDKEKISDLKLNVQGVPGYLTFEGDSRKSFRKWDNVKTLIEKIPTKKVPRDSYGNGLWAIKVTTSERLAEKHGVGLHFGLVVTLKEMNGVNRIDDFIQLCSLRGWLVTQIDIENRIDIYNTAEQEIEFD